MDREKMILDNIGIVKKIVYKMRHLLDYYPLNDLLQYGYIGLINAVDKYNVQYGRFSPFAWKHVRGAIIDGCYLMSGKSKWQIKHNNKIEFVRMDLEYLLTYNIDFVDLWIDISRYQKKRQFVIKKRIEGFCYREIGEMLGVSEGRAVQILQGI